MQTIRCFEPVADQNSRVLILGSMPGKESLRKQQYYGHKQNAFWRLMCALLSEPYNEDYQTRLIMLLAHGIAIWDVIQSCERESSLDAHIKNAQINDFATFFATHPHISHVFFNGAKAHNTFVRHAGREFESIAMTRLGSTSPAHAIPFETRLADWRRILPYIEENT